MGNDVRLESLQVKLFLSEEGYGQGGNALLAEAEKSGEQQTKASVERRSRKED